MNNPVDPKTPEEIEDWRVQEMCRAVLGASVLPSDSHEENYAGRCQPLMIDDGAWYFVPHYTTTLLCGVGA